MSRPVRRFRTEDGWSDWINIDEALQYPHTGTVETFDGKEILEYETKPSLASTAVYPTPMLKMIKPSITVDADLYREAATKVSELLEEHLKETMLESLGIGLNCEEPDVLTANMLKEKMKKIELDMEKARLEKIRELERKESERAYEDNADYGQF